MARKAAWLLPVLLEGSGGHRTIIQNAQYLADHGYECDLYIEDDGQFGDADELKRHVEKLFGKISCGVKLGFRIEDEYDIVFATVWYTANIVRRIKTNAKKAYFVQDFEAQFNPMGDGYLSAVNSYSLGLKTITIGHWLTQKLNTEYGAACWFFDFCCDNSIYHPIKIEKEDAICFICQPEKPRRCVMLGLKALEIVKALRPDIKIYFYGSRSKQTVLFEHEELGLLSLEKCNELYNRCRVGLCLSSSNPSRIPFEMMSAGLPVVDLYMENNVFDMPDDAILLAKHTPEAIARALINVIDSDRLQADMSRGGIEFMRGRTIEAGFEQFFNAVDDIIENRSNGSEIPRKIYLKPPVVEDAVVCDVSDDIEANRAQEQTSGIVSFLKRIPFLRRNKFIRKIWRAIKALRGNQ